MQKNKQPKQKKTKILFAFSLNTLIIIALFVGIIVMGELLSKDSNTTTPVATVFSVSELAKGIQSGEVTTITVKGDTITAVLVNGESKTTTKESGAPLSETLVNYGITGEQLQTVSIVNKSDSGFWFVVLNLLPILFPVLIIAFFFYMISRQMNNAGGMKALSFGQSKAKLNNETNKQITFADVAGNIEAKNELVDIVDFLKHPKKYFDVGARIPKGVLLTGHPGTGKTLLARAVAGEAGVPFFHLSGSEFVEMFVGVGASRVRDLFDQAKKASPAIIFIDEIDAVGRARGIGHGGGNDEREQTLNQILVEMDGFEPTEKIVIIAATNRADVLDPALTRPGRFDRTVFLDLPDRKDRRAILEIHAHEKPIDESVDLETIAVRTPGFSGADLQSLLNEAAITTAKNNQTTITQTVLLNAIEKVMVGTERASHMNTVDERKIIAYHEAGHALLASLLHHSDPVHKISIIARGNAGGYTLKLPLIEKKLNTRNYFLDELVMTLGGYVAEKLAFGDVTTGPSNDLQVATNLARTMVTKWGMSELLGPVAYAGNGRSMFGGSGVDSRDLSSETEKIIDSEIQSLMKHAETRATELLTTHKTVLDAISNALLDHETLEQSEYDTLLASHGITVKTKES